MASTLRHTRNPVYHEANDMFTQSTAPPTALPNCFHINSSSTHSNLLPCLNPSVPLQEFISNRCLFERHSCNRHATTFAAAERSQQPHDIACHFNSLLTRHRPVRAGSDFLLVEGPMSPSYRTAPRTPSNRVSGTVPLPHWTALAGSDQRLQRHCMGPQRTTFHLPPLNRSLSLEQQNFRVDAPISSESVVEREVGFVDDRLKRQNSYESYSSRLPSTALLASPAPPSVSLPYYNSGLILNPALPSGNVWDRSMPRPSRLPLLSEPHLGNPSQHPTGSYIVSHPSITAISVPSTFENQMHPHTSQSNCRRALLPLQPLQPLSRTPPQRVVQSHPPPLFPATSNAPGVESDTTTQLARETWRLRGRGQRTSIDIESGRTEEREDLRGRERAASVFGIRNCRLRVRSSQWLWRGDLLETLGAEGNSVTGRRDCVVSIPPSIQGSTSAAMLFLTSTTGPQSRPRPPSLGNLNRAQQTHEDGRRVHVPSRSSISGGIDEAGHISAVATTDRESTPEQVNMQDSELIAAAAGPDATVLGTSDENRRVVDEVARRSGNSGVRLGDNSFEYEDLLEPQARVAHISRGLSVDQIDLLPEESYANVASMERECLICCSDYELSEKLRRLPCWHMFHSRCIDKWLLDRKTCPLCRFEVDQAIYAQLTQLDSQSDTTVNDGTQRDSMSTGDEDVVAEQSTLTSDEESQTTDTAGQREAISSVFEDALSSATNHAAPESESVVEIITSAGEEQRDTASTVENIVHGILASPTVVQQSVVGVSPGTGEPAAQAQPAAGIASAIRAEQCLAVDSAEQYPVNGSTPFPLTVSYEREPLMDQGALEDREGTDSRIEGCWRQRVQISCQGSRNPCIAGSRPPNSRPVDGDTDAPTCLAITGVNSLEGYVFLAGSGASLIPPQDGPTHVGRANSSSPYIDSATIIAPRHALDRSAIS